MKQNLFLIALAGALVAGCATRAPVPPTASTGMATAPGNYVITAPDGSCEITIDTTRAPDLRDWAERKLAPVLAQWYPKIAAIIPSPGYTPPKKFSVAIRPGDGVAATGGTRVTANATWFRGQTNGQGIGALVHEEVHVVQQYGGARGRNAAAQFRLADITNLAAMARRLSDQSDPLSAFLNSQLDAPTRKALAACRGPGPKAFVLRTNLVANLNKIAAGPSIYDDARFRGVALRTNTLSLRGENPEGADLARLNRALLEDAFPTELARASGRTRSNTGWLTEGIPDYIRWFLYEPQAHGADMVWMAAQYKKAQASKKDFTPHYNDSYRYSANFLNWVTAKYDRQIVRKLNAALRQGAYYDDIWRDNTGKTAPALGDEWLATVNKHLLRTAPPPPNPKS